MPSPLSRRQFLGAAALGAASLAAPPTLCAKTSQWTIGCLNRPWSNWSTDEMLDGIATAGFRTIGLQTPTKSDPFVGSTATPDYLARLKEKIAARGLTVIQSRLRTMDNATFEQATSDIRQQITNARALGVRTLLSTGTNKSEHYENWYRLMGFAARHGADHGVRIVTKPHGGVVATGADLLKCLEKVGHENFSIWYDAGNILFYTGLDPLAELEPVISHVTAFTGKDCEGLKSNVMIQFGRGKVDFSSIFRRLKRASFHGPVMMESCAIGATPDETSNNARANREFLERVLSDLNRN